MGKESPPEHRTTIAYRLRHAAGMTQEEAADTVQINVRSWQRFESRDKPIPETIVRLFCAKTQLDDRVFLPDAVDREREPVPKSPLKVKDV